MSQSFVESILAWAWNFGWNWLWLMLAIPVLFALGVFARWRGSVRKREQKERDRKDRFARIQAKRKSRIVAIIHREEFGGHHGPERGSIELDDSDAVLSAIRATNPNKPLEIVLHTLGGNILPALQIARAVKAHPGKKTVFVPHHAMSGGTLIALAADEIVMGDHAVLGPIDPQLAGLPAASWIRVAKEKPINAVDDFTLLVADLAEKLLSQMQRQACELMQGNYSHDGSCTISDILASGKWSHDYPITVPEAQDLGLRVSTHMPPEIIELTAMYSASDVRRPSVYYTPGRV